MNKKKITILFKVFVCLTLLYAGLGFAGCAGDKGERKKGNSTNTSVFRMLSGSENKEFEEPLMEFANKNQIKLEIEYAGTLDLIRKIDQDPEGYDGVWLSNSIWFSMLENPSQIRYSKFTSINPVIFGIRMSRAEELGFTDSGKVVYMQDIVDAVNGERLNFIMPSATQTNSGASAYFGFISCLSGNTTQGTLTMESLEGQELKNSLAQLLRGVSRSSGDEGVAGDIFIAGNYDGIVNYESSLLMLNAELQEKGMEPLYLVYPYDGVSLSDSPFAYIENGDKKKEEEFNKLQGFLLSEEMRDTFAKRGRRTEYGGLIENNSENIFNPDWGVKTDDYLSPIRYPSASVMKQALNIYQNELRRPACIVFCLDYSGSMEGRGRDDLVSAMEYILDYEKASQDYIQFSEKDVIHVIPFSSNSLDYYETENGRETNDLMDKIRKLRPRGGTNIYTPLVEAAEILKGYDEGVYTKSVVLMTDGLSYEEEKRSFVNYYETMNGELPVFSITFGDADQSQLKVISELTNGIVVDGKDGLIEAFKMIRGYN